MSILIPFDFSGQGARGVILRIDEGVEAMFGARDYSADVRQLLGEAAAAAPMLASNLKFEGRINLQFQGGDRIQLLVAQVDHQLRVRAMAKAGPEIDGSFKDLLQGGLLAWLLEPRHGQPYQAFVEISGDSLAASLEGYFAQSEQLPTRLLLASGATSLAGLLLQRVPGADGDDADGYWQHLCALFGTLKAEELLAADSDTVLRRLFHQEPLRRHGPREVQLSCTCSRASISQMLLSLGRDEIEPIFEERDHVEVTCEFCGREYRYVRSEVQELFDGAEAQREPNPIQQTH